MIAFRQVDIRVQLDLAARADMATFENLRVRRAAGGSVPLTAVASVDFGQGPTALERYDRDRRVAIEGDLAPGYPLGAALEAVKSLPEAKNLPAGVTLKEFGDVEIMNEVFQGFAVAMAAGVLGCARGSSLRRGRSREAVADRFSRSPQPARIPRRGRHG